MIRIGGASGYWGESGHATPQLLAAGVDVLVYDYLAEITMSLLARARMKDPKKGYAPDFISAVMKPNLGAIAASGTKVISNAGGINPSACGAILREIIVKAGLDLKVAVVEGDDLLPDLHHISKEAPEEVTTGKTFPAGAPFVSVNAYLGAFPIAEALGLGADIVITGRVVDSALTLGALIHHYGWGTDDLDLLAAGSLVGHLLECGPQATGGNFTDWRDVPDITNIGYPIAEVKQDGTAVITKPDNTGGLVSRGTISEQLVYEIADPYAYLLPDVTCDFSQVLIEEVGADRVLVSGARGRPAPEKLKVSATHVAGWRGGILLSFYGFEASEKAELFAQSAFDRSQHALRAKNLAPFTETSVEVLGAGTQFGESGAADEVILKLAARHTEESGIGVLLKETMGLGLATPPGLCGFAGGRAKPSPVVQLFSFLCDRDRVKPTIDVGEGGIPCTIKPVVGSGEHHGRPVAIGEARETDDMVDVLLIEAAWARSGDKGDSANIGVVARHPELLPYLWEQLTEAAVAERFAHVLNGEVSRFLMPGPGAINFLLTESLGGGGIASLRNDPQGKGFAQVMLTMPIRVPQHLLAGARP